MPFRKKTRQRLDLSTQLVYYAEITFFTNQIQFMKNNQIVALLLTFGMLLSMSTTFAQVTTPAPTPGKAIFNNPEMADQKLKPYPGFKTSDALPVVPMCKGCVNGLPTQVFNSTKNAATIFGPPDSKGDPVEYQVFTQAKAGGDWKLEARGQVQKPGEQLTFKYYRPAQLLVLIYCKTPFAGMVTFSNIRVPAPSNEGPCTDCACERCQQPLNTFVYSGKTNNLTISRVADAATPVEYQVFSQAKDKTWKTEKTNILKGKGDKASDCYGSPAQMLVVVYGQKPSDVAVDFWAGPCRK
jgi:hypothetical protein